MSILFLVPIIDIYLFIYFFQCSGRLKFTDQNIAFKNTRTGKVEQLTSSDIEFVNWQKLVGTCGIRIFLKNGNLHRYSGFNESVSLVVNFVNTV